MIIITGSGRSGTSILSKILFEYGMKMENLDEWRWNNQNCGFERYDVARLNREICKRKSHIGLVEKKRLKEAALEFKNRMAKIEAAVTMIKDPRFSKSIESWILAGIKIEHVINVIRDPWDVAKSHSMCDKMYFKKSLEDTAYEMSSRIGSLITTLEKHKISYTNVYYPDDFIGINALSNLSNNLGLDHKKLKKICNSLFDINTNYLTRSGKLRR